MFAKRSAGAKFLLDATEIVSSKLQRDDVKQIAGRLREHAQVALAGIQAAAFQGTGTTGAQPQFSGDQQQEINQLGRLNEMQLSTRYVQAMIGELQQQQRLLEGFARNGTEASFRNFAQQYLPDVKADLDALRGMEMSR
ncbi:MAG: hypothetical protein JWM36_2097 [Hyphomicrobiales bacterium]|nr:hypothetical protein [Hyphomicrobiales bacterium]